MNPTFRALEDPPGLRLVDRIENTRFTFETPRPVEPGEAGTEGFYYPVDSTATVEASVLVAQKLLDVYVRSADDGTLLGESSNRTDLEMPPDAYNVEVSTSEMKIYLDVESAVVVRRDDDSVAIDFGDETMVTVGARSYHERPSHAITITEDVSEAMEAVSTFGSALKSLTPERSYPTLRGHPPLLKLGDEFSIPDDLEWPDTGIELQVRPRWDSLFPVASLAYYLGARVVPTDDEPRLVTEHGFAHPLDGPGGYEATVARTLKQVFFLDCITRTEGTYGIDLRERELAEPAVDFDLAETFGRSIAEQVEAYLCQEFDALSPYMPAWKQTADVWPSPDQVKALPYVANDLAAIRCPTLPESTEPNPVPKAMVDFYRSASSDGSDGSDGKVFSVEPTDSLEHVWFGDGFPMGATKASPDAYRRQFDVEPRDDIGIEVTVVCNDPEMFDEVEYVSELYGASDNREFTVSLHQDLTVSELREVLETPVDFLHYVGHVEPDGIECVNGMLDARELDRAGSKAFLLNGCTSYLQANALVEKGSIGGVGTLAKVGNSTASGIGGNLARLLNHGYPLQAALSIVAEDKFATINYTLVGHGGVQLVIKQNGSPSLASIRRVGESFEVQLKTFPTENLGLGSHSSNSFQNERIFFIRSGEIGPFRVSRTELGRLLKEGAFPIKSDKGILWSNDTSAEDL